MSKVYIVMEKSFEYNDEIYYTPESGGGNPENVFTDKEKAEQFARQKNVEFMKAHNPSEFSYEPSLEFLNKNISQQDALTKLKAVGVDFYNEEYLSMEKPWDKDWTPEQVEVIVEVFSRFSMFYIVEMDMD